MNVSRLIYMGLGWLSVGLGGLGIIFPLLPTTPFLLLAVWAFSRSSPELAERIRSHQLVGPHICAWQDHGVIPAKGKFLAVLMMGVSGGYMLYSENVPIWLSASVCVGMLAVAGYILTRPGCPPLSQ